MRSYSNPPPHSGLSPSSLRALFDRPVAAPSTPPSANRTSTTEAETRKAAGLTAAATDKNRLIMAGELALIDALLAHPEHTATTDDITDRLDQAYSDGGKWRGSIPRRLVGAKLIEKAGVIQSVRTHRNRGYLTLWKAVDLAGLYARGEDLRRRLPRHDTPTVGDE